MAARINLVRASKGLPRLGSLNPTLYTYHGATPGTTFHDIVEGANRCPAPGGCHCAEGFAAAAGWDPVSGFGSVDAQALYETAQQQWADGGDVADDGSKLYRGQKAYKQYTSKPENFNQAVLTGQGPARAPVHYRATSRFDYQPDICKDYKDTGFCGYGDACKFLHDRSDYKAGWQLEKEWEQQQRDKEHKAALDAFSGAESSSSLPQPVDDGLPFACLICREPWHARSAPVVTKCEHYFCEACALKHAQKTKRCFVCAENTGGIFNRSKALQAKIDQLKAKEEVEAGGEQTDESVLAEYAEATKQKRGFTGGWGFV